jgi:aconitate hydratase
MKQPKTIDLAAFYSKMSKSLQKMRQRLNRPLTLTEKILLSHLYNPEDFKSFPERGKAQVPLQPDRVAMQDATAQMAMLQYMQAGLQEVAVPTSIHCDHLIRAKSGAHLDLKEAVGNNQEVYEFLKSAAFAHGITFGAPGKGIIHQVILENLAFPGGLMVGTDSHTPNAGGLGMLAIGVGGADAVEVMAGEPWALTWPLLIGVKLTGKLNGWTAPKDIILKIAGILGAAGGTSAIIEYFGPGTAHLGATGQATIANMGAELGATTSVFPYSEATKAYLKATARADWAQIVSSHQDLLRADADVEANPEKYFDRVIEIDLDTLEPHIVGPFTPDLARPLSQFAQEAREKGYPLDLRFALIGSCTNSSYEDMGRAAHIARQAARAGLQVACGFLVTPGSTQIFNTIERDGQLADFEAIGAQVMANACGPCIGQWHRSDTREGEPNSIINSFNRPFKGRNDNNPATHAFIASPEIVTAFALAGRLDFNPLTDEIPLPDGGCLKLKPPTADALPLNGFVGDSEAIVGAPDNVSFTVNVAPTSQRLQLLEAFSAWDGKDYLELPILLKANGKCTTDHISPAGEKWLRYRGHLDNISNNMFSRVSNSLSGEIGMGTNIVTGESKELQAVARDYKALGLGWAAIGDTNYGEGSSREHAAMSPRYLGAKAVVAKSFARIHRSNLFKQGVLALTFVNAADYDKILPGDKLSILGLANLVPEQPLSAVITHVDGSRENILLSHGMGPEQITWFIAGSFLNYVRNKTMKPEDKNKKTEVECEGCAFVNRIVTSFFNFIKRIFS